MLKKFRSSTDGNVAIMTGAFILILLILGGGAVDIIRVTTIRAELQSATDSAVLASGALASQGDPAVVAENYFAANFNGSRYSITNVEFSAVATTNTRVARVVNAEARTSVPTLFLKFLDVFNGGDRFNAIEIVVNAQAQERIQPIEIAMVLDVSGSMAGLKINNLRSSASAFVDQLFDGANPELLSFSLIPFSENVNIAPIVEDYVDPAVLPADGSPVADPCILYEDVDFNDEAIVEFRDLAHNPFSLVEQITLGVASLTNLALSRDRCLNVPVFLNSNNATALKAEIGNFTAAGRTDAHLGMLWGVKALSPAFRGQLGGDFPSRPIDYNSNSLKALIVMTDGDLNPLEDEDGVQRADDATVEFQALCNSARMNGVLVFSIGFQIADGSKADELLEMCASNQSQYFFVEDLDLDRAFDSIAAQIRNLRISQ